MQKKPNLRNNRILFYRRTSVLLSGEDGVPLELNPFVPGSDAVTETDEYGEAVETYMLVAGGLCSKSKASKPIEVIDGGVSGNQTQYLLDAVWTKTLMRVDSSCIAVDFADRKVYEVLGDAIDPIGDRQKVNVYVVDNVRRVIDIDSLPRTFPA